MVNIVSGKSEKLKEMQEKDARIVKGRFNCFKPKGGEITFPYRKYKGEPIRTYTLKDGHEYDLPLGVAKHLNNCGHEVHAYLLDEHGNPHIGVGTKEHRFAFQSVEFI